MTPLIIPSEGTNLNILGIPMVVRLRGSDTGGTVGVAESHDVSGSGPPLHIHHREDETFQVLEGEYEWMVGDKTFVAGKGTTIFAPRGIPHGYRYIGTEPGRLMCTITPAGFEGFFEEVGALSSEEQQDLPRIMTIAATYGLEFLPPPNA
ncbi:MAG: cupin domain-containing protein [Verrucomicrobiaceae bacterium]|nr:MAG: cupin domain-containing protein [Verrucomicrobiaceae bacterium]